MRTKPAWLAAEPYIERELGALRSGKEAQVDVVERTDDDGQVCVLARKRYIPRVAAHKGHLESLGVQRASTFRNDVTYREGRQFRKSRDRRAVEQMTTHGKRLLQDRWTGHEFEVMGHLWEAGLDVPYPVSYGDDLFYMEYIGALDGAAPQLAQARLDRVSLEDAWAQLVDGLQTMVEAGWAHADLSAFNLLWWEGRLVFIDFPQAVDIAANPQGLDFLHRDVTNVCGWFARRGVEHDPEELFVELLHCAWS